MLIEYVCVYQQLSLLQDIVNILQSCSNKILKSKIHDCSMFSLCRRDSCYKHTHTQSTSTDQELSIEREHRISSRFEFICSMFLLSVINTHILNQHLL